MQVADSYVGLDQTFWLDTYTSEQPAGGTANGADGKESISIMHERDKHNLHH